MALIDVINKLTCYWAICMYHTQISYYIPSMV